jgi:hypothetical protein
LSVGPGYAKIEYGQNSLAGEGVSGVLPVIEETSSWKARFVGPVGVGWRNNAVTLLTSFGSPPSQGLAVGC